MKEKLDKFVKLVQERSDNYYEKSGYLNSPKINIREGKVYWKVVREATQTSVFCFINKSTGEIYFPAGWSAPSKKNPRGNLSSPQNGMEAVSENGQYINYLRG